MKNVELLSEYVNSNITHLFQGLKGDRGKGGPPGRVGTEVRNSCSIKLNKQDIKGKICFAKSVFSRSKTYFKNK